jgi:hypothetical protein
MSPAPLALLLASSLQAGSFLCSVQDPPIKGTRARGCTARACEKDPAARAKQDQERAERLKAGKHETTQYPGLKVRVQLIDRSGAENDCREFVVEDCYYESLENEKPFKYEYVLTGSGQDMVWTLEKLEGIEWKRPHRFKFNPLAKRNQYTSQWETPRWPFDEAAARKWDDAEKKAGRTPQTQIFCPIDRLDKFGGDGWREPVFNSGAVRMVVTGLEHLHKGKDD